MEIFKARNFSIGVLGVNVWSRDCLFGFARSPWDFFWFWFLPPFDHPRHLNFEVPPLEYIHHFGSIKVNKMMQLCQSTEFFDVGK